MTPDHAAVLARLDKITPGKWRVRDEKGLWWSVETELPCINGLRCWFTITRCDFDLAADGYTDGAVSPEDDARAIALLPELIAVAKAAAELRKMPRTGDASVEKMVRKMDDAQFAKWERDTLPGLRERAGGKLPPVVTAALSDRKTGVEA